MNQLDKVLAVGEKIKPKQKSEIVMQIEAGRDNEKKIKTYLIDNGKGYLISYTKLIPNFWERKIEKEITDSEEYSKMIKFIKSCGGLK